MYAIYHSRMYSGTTSNTLVGYNYGAYSTWHPSSVSCSLICFKSHKDGQSCVKPIPVHPTDQPPLDDAGVGIELKMEHMSSKEKDTILVPNKDPVLSQEMLEKLRTSDVISGMLQKPDLRDLLVKINSSSFPEALLDHHMDRPGIFKEFTQEALKVTGRTAGIDYEEKFKI
ncbi:hypothetical protein BASA50_001535 [Batrachochytrium salamandrivorans]|uniref:DEUBAD domain-containing protein n=1 Tax=Batrachochytrium salamandrivorans TaxID=1357716 RepID=A0ABQ8FRK0_9FUNG|nr:hypothetical protein BASA60_010974 [Batrachochytrium salamandrivorans]KAH6601498.1 hypothetical protein BASA50_001535 [Batrachochytrium salamandrivorans]